MNDIKKPDKMVAWKPHTVVLPFNEAGNILRDAKADVSTYGKDIVKDVKELDRILYLCNKG